MNSKRSWLGWTFCGPLCGPLGPRPMPGLGACAAVASLLLLMPMAGVAAERLNVLCAADNDWCELMRNAFEAETHIGVSMVRKSAGEIFAQIRAEANNPKTDLWWAGTGDPHLQAAADGF